MAAPNPAPNNRPSHGGVIPAEWPAQAADTIVDTITKVRDRTTKPAIVAARTLIYGTLAAVVGIMAFILVIIVLVRSWHNWSTLPIWVLYALLGAGFSAAGFYCLHKANAPRAEDPADI